MRRKVAAALLAAGLFAAAACGDDNGGGGSTEEVCEKVDTEGAEAADRFQAAVPEMNAALAAEDEVGALAAATDAQNAVDDLVTVLRDGAEQADDEEFSTALDDAATELETFIGSLDIEAIQAGEVPDGSAVDTAFDELNAFCP